LLFDDIQNLKSNEYHFCGFIFLFCDDKENYMLLDGQQRLTTLFLLSRLVALRDDRLKE
jgi:uncharacterized protein with ParB-like and HNH nuclease domain